MAARQVSMMSMRRALSLRTLSAVARDTTKTIAAQRIHQTQTRPSSTSSPSSLTAPPEPEAAPKVEDQAQPAPPWQVQDLNRLEREAYDKYGPHYLAHLNKFKEEEQRLLMHMPERRAAAAREFENKFGPNWYPIVSTKNALMHAPQTKILADRKKRIQEARTANFAAVRQADEEKKKAIQLAGEKVAGAKEKLKKQIAAIVAETKEAFRVAHEEAADRARAEVQEKMGGKADGKADGKVDGQ